MTDILRGLGERAIMFGDGARGSHTQVYVIVRMSDKRDLPIVKTAVKPDRDHPWEITAVFRDVEYSSLEEAVAAWMAAGEPLE